MLKRRGLSSKREEEEKLHSHRSPSVVGRASHRRYVREDLFLLFSLNQIFFSSVLCFLSSFVNRIGDSIV